MPDTSSKKMDQTNVLYPPSRHAELAAWRSVKADLDKIVGPRLVGGAKGLKIHQADELVKQALETKDAKKHVYFKIGLVGNDLVLRVKAKSSGIGQILGYDQKDALLLRGCKLKPAKTGGAKEADYSFPKYIVLSPSECSTVVREHFEVSGPYSIKLSVNIDGAEKSPNLTNTVGRIHTALCTEYRTKANAIVTELERQLLACRVKSGATLTELAADAQQEFESLLDDKTLQKEFKNRVSKTLKEDQNFRDHAKEWVVKGVCNTVLSTIKLATAFIRVVASHGAEVTAYFSILSNGYAIYALITDFMKKEVEIAAELTKAIDLYQRSANDLLETVKAEFAANNLTATTKLEKITSATGAASNVLAIMQNKITAKIKEITDKDVGQAPEKARRRYLVELGKLVFKLDKHFAELENQTGIFTNGTILNAVRMHPALVMLQRQCNVAKDAFMAKKRFAEAAKDKIERLGIEVDDRTDLTKLKTMVAGLREPDKSKVIEGASITAGLASNVKEAYGTVKAFAGAVQAFT